MQDSSSFKHIKVSASGHDEVVIKAGKHPGEAEIASKGEGAHDAAEPKASSASVDGKASVASGNREPEAGAYSPTTLEDIKTSKMSKVQIAVIAIAVVAIAAFAIWYAAFS